ncbi:MAG: bifunctional folylpolyglutamate synthase/dihydrofolate synthase [Thermoplasmata archaeon]|nr:MAG: bifunctional folylpolyglutamate synthase/dihydrofolate synthase [Thermoplasmata archaeon]
MWIDELKEREISLGLERMKKVMNEMPSYKIIHVGGTNGKGSVCNFIASILMQRYSVGLYTSPHLERVNERIVVNGKEIEDAEIEEYRYLKKYNLTYFEALTAIALHYFERKKVDYAVIEVGLGGRLDATNVVEPELSIITNVAMEHENFLGNDIVSIAKEKAGIIKNAPVITACKGRALEVIKNTAEKKGVQLYIIGEDVKWYEIDENKFLIEADERYLVHSPLKGKFQGENIGIAIKAGEIIGMKKEDIIEGIEKATLYGRMEKIGRFLLDGCHNPHAVKAFSASIEKPDIIIFGVMKDKNVEEMIKNLPKARIYIATKASNERAMEANKIASIGKKFGKEFLVTENVKEAIEQAENYKAELICIVGSLYLIGEARKIIRRKIINK